MPWRSPWVAQSLGLDAGPWLAASGGIYSIAVHGDRFVVVETDNVGSFDELRQLLQA